MIAVTAATGHLGRLVVDALLERGVPADQVVAAVRNPAKAADLAARGVQVRLGDYTVPDSLASALAGVDEVLLISSNDVGRRVAQHQNVIDAAKAVGVKLLAYTSILNADATTMRLAAEHKATEAAIRASGLPRSFLRNGFYLENYTDPIPTHLERGEIIGSADNGRISAATRADLAEAAAVVLTGEGHADSVYELGGDRPFTLPELAATLTDRTGTQVVYRDLPVEEYISVLVGTGLPEPMAALVADSDRGVASGDLFTDSGDLHRLIGRTPTTLDDILPIVVERIRH
jgi:NAD(P)H dehydrogenase (quinone)